MKKILVIIALIISIMVLNKDNSIVIPDSSIRFRVIANSNSVDDQLKKNRLSSVLQDYLYSLTKDSKSYESSKKILDDNYDNINKFIKDNLGSNKYMLSIGKNYFPEKKFKGIKYKSGYYDSVVVNIGQSEGNNWWCVIYPPLCLIPEDTEEVEYTSIVKEIFNV